MDPPYLLMSAQEGTELAEGGGGVEGVDGAEGLFPPSRDLGCGSGAPVRGFKIT